MLIGNNGDKKGGKERTIFKILS